MSERGRFAAISRALDDVYMHVEYEDQRLDTEFFLERLRESGYIIVSLKEWKELDERNE